MRGKIGGKIRELRESRKWNQARLALELAKALGKQVPIASATVSRYEEGKRAVKPEVLAALAGIFEVKPSFFYEDASVSEPRASYGPGTNTKRITIIEEIPLSFPEYRETDVAGYAELPRFIFPGAEFMIKAGDGFSPGGAVSEGDYILVAPAGGEAGGGRIFYKLEGIFFVGHPPKKPSHAEVLGKVVGIIKK
jgi:transcriptional regulator with XRE-family HTH domain